MKKTATLLDNPTAPKTYRIRLLLQENKTAEFIYSDRTMARSHWDQIRATNVVGNNAVKQSEFLES
jgi:hypothetical protein